MEVTKDSVKIGLIGYQHIKNILQGDYSVYILLYTIIFWLINGRRHINKNMNAVEEYNYFYKDRKIIIKAGKESDLSGDALYYAKANFKGILALAECKEKALENCIKKIKFSISLLEKKIGLIEQNKAIVLAKKCFEKNFSNKEIIKCYRNKLSYNIFVEDETLTLTVTVSNNYEISDVKEMDVIAIIYVNLITGECDIIENNVCGSSL